MQQGASHIGKYEIITRVGRGGMGEVFKAFHPQLQRHVAIKILLTTIEADSGLTTRFQHEAQAVARLRHPHIVQVFDYDIEDQRPYMVMEFVEGETLAQRMRRFHQKGQLLPIAEVTSLLQQLCSAVDYAHQQGMLHRDIKPANVILNHQHDAILTDFGIARIAGVSGLTASGLVIGTPRYMSPEQAQGLPVDERSDVYSLSLIFYELLTGKLPFEADTPIGMVMQHVMTQPLPITVANPAVPPMLAEIALVGLAKNPNERFHSAGAMRTAIAGAMDLTLVTSGSSTRGSPVSGSVESSQDGDLLPTISVERPHQPSAREPQTASPESPIAEGNTTSTPSGAAAKTTVIASIEPPVIEAVALPREEGENQPSSSSGSGASTLQSMTVPPLSPEGVSGNGAAKHQPSRHLGRWLVSCTLVLLLILTSTLLALNLVNRGAYGASAGAPTRTPYPKIEVGLVTFSDSDPNDFSHPANNLSAEFISLKAPAQDATYFAWLCDTGAAACTLLGAVTVQADGSASLHFSRSGDWLQEQNPAQPATSITFEITQEHTPATANPEHPSGQVIYSGQLPAGILVHLRHEMADFPKQGVFQGNTTPLITGLGKDAILLQQLSTQLQQYQIAGDLSNMQENAVYLLNLILGKTSAQDGDHDGDTNNDIAPGDDGFGLGSTADVSHLSQGCQAEQMNYLPFVVEHACNAAFGGGDTPALQRLFNEIQAAGTNIAMWVTKIEQIAQKVLAATQASDVTQGDANTLVNEADMILSGVTGDVQNQDGVNQMLQYIEQMATITVSTA